MVVVPPEAVVLLAVEPPLSGVPPVSGMPPVATVLPGVDSPPVAGTLVAVVDPPAAVVPPTPGDPPVEGGAPCSPELLVEQAIRPTRVNNGNSEPRRVVGMSILI